MQRLEVSGAVRPIYGSLGVKRLTIWGLVQLIPYIISLILIVEEDWEEVADLNIWTWVRGDDKWTEHTAEWAALWTLLFSGCYWGHQSNIRSHCCYVWTLYCRLPLEHWNRGFECHRVQGFYLRVLCNPVILCSWSLCRPIPHPWSPIMTERTSQKEGNVEVLESSL